MVVVLEGFRRFLNGACASRPEGRGDIRRRYPKAQRASDHEAFEHDYRRKKYTSVNASNRNASAMTTKRGSRQPFAT
jgi:hypothetical protein